MSVKLTTVDVVCMQTVSIHWAASVVHAEEDFMVMDSIAKVNVFFIALELCTTNEFILLAPFREQITYFMSTIT